MGTARTREEHLKRATGSFDLIDDSARAARAAGAVDSANLNDMREASVEGASSASRKAGFPSASSASPVVSPSSSVSAAGASTRSRVRTNNPRVLKAEAAAAEMPAAGVASAEVVAAKASAAGERHSSASGFSATSVADASAASAMSAASGAAPDASTTRAAASGARPSVARSRVARPQVAPAGESRESDDLDSASSGDFASAPGISDAVMSSTPARRRARRAARRGASQGAVGSDAPRTSERSRRVESPARRRGVVAALVVIGVLVVLVVAAVGSFSVFRWIANDDVQDIQGTWYISGTDTPVVITEDKIQLNEEVAYWYDLNTDSKTIAFTFSYLEGAGRYRFSFDRQQLAIVDGTYGWWDTLADDAAWTVRALISLAQGTQLDPADGEGGGVSSLTRTPESAS